MGYYHSLRRAARRAAPQNSIPFSPLTGSLPLGQAGTGIQLNAFRFAGRLPPPTSFPLTPPFFTNKPPFIPICISPPTCFRVLLIGQLVGRERIIIRREGERGRTNKTKLCPP